MKRFDVCDLQEVVEREDGGFVEYDVAVAELSALRAERDALRAAIEEHCNKWGAGITGKLRAALKGE